jgi:hypothetical protein
MSRKITVVSRDRATRRGVEDYLQRAGICVEIVSSLADARRSAAGADAMVLFADDYERTTFFAAIDQICRSRRRTMVIVVTEAVDDFGPSSRWADRVIVLRRPAWAWMLLDELRGDRRRGANR